ncbi:hypothetical protein RHECNPAF_1760076 [Rhizobium etli CNPAF512]|nr:hypothetical protein RHECNPAF_1760076 [Rhizobium etli CNPAF512]
MLFRVAQYSFAAAEAVAQDMEKEDRNADDVAPPKARGLLYQPIGPFEAHHPHRLRRSRNGAGDEVEERAYRQHQTRMVGADVVVDPFLLQRRPHADDQNVELLALDLPGDIGGVDLVKKAVGNDDKFMPGCVLAEIIRRRLDDRARAADQADAARSLHEGEEGRHEIGTVQIGGKRRAMGDLRCDIEADAIRQHQIVRHDSVIIIVAQRGQHIMGVDEANHGLADGNGGQLVDKNECIIPAEIADRQIEDRPPRRKHREVCNQIHSYLLPRVRHAPDIPETKPIFFRTPEVSKGPVASRMAASPRSRKTAHAKL